MNLLGANAKEIQSGILEFQNRYMNNFYFDSTKELKGAITKIIEHLADSTKNEDGSNK